jgi:Holliday junction DNA helicase RuvA
MITLLDGILDEKQPTRAVVLCGGVGYEVHIPLSSFDKLPVPGAHCRILTHHHVWADGQALYGFATEAERRMFRLLLDVSGIGPKTALSALSGLPARDLTAAVVGGDVKRLSTISGIGKKTAERIVLELRDKITEGEAMAAIAGVGEPGAGDFKRRDAALALVSLGYKQAEAQKMVAAISAEDAAAVSVEDLVRRALTGR